MSDQQKDYLSNEYANAAPLPQATATLVLGILSIVACFICGIVALVISKRDLNAYNANPELYSAASYNNLKAGRICAVIGIVLQLIFIILYIVIIAVAVNYAKSFN